MYIIPSSWFMKYVYVKISNSGLWLKWTFAYCCCVYFFLSGINFILWCIPNPPHLAGSILSRNTGLRDSVCCSLTINTKSYTVLLLMSLINHLGQLDDPVISVCGINLPIENYLKVCPDWLCRKHSWPFWCQTQGTFSHHLTDAAHQTLLNTLYFLGHSTPLGYFSPRLLIALWLANVRCLPHPLLSPPYHISCESILSLMAQIVNSLPAVPETRVRSLGWEDPLEKEMATHSNILSWKIPWT